jgi:O-antigen/teichoic acid export membrane protein
MNEKLAKNTSYITIASIGQKIIAFVYFLFIARMMMPEMTGVYFLATSVISLFAVISDFGINPVVIREIAKKPGDVKRIVKEALGAKLLFMLIAVVGVFVATYFLNYDSLTTKMIYLTILVMLVDTITLLFYGVLRGQQRLKFEAFGMFSGQVVTSIFGAISLIFFPSLYFLVVALILGSTANLLISSRNVVKQFGATVLVPIFNKRKFITLFKIALPFALAGIFTRVYSTVDTILVSKFLDAASVGVYSIAYKFTYAFQFLPLAFVAALYPNLSSLVENDKEGLRDTFMRAMWYMMIIAVPIVFGIWLIANEAVLLAGVEYSAAAPVLQLLIFALLPIFLDFPIGSLLNAANRQTTKTIIIGITMLISVVLNVILVPKFGLIGAATSAIISFSFMFVAGMFFIKQIIPTFSYLNLAGVLGRILCSGIIMLFVGYWLKPIVGWILIIPVSGIVYFITLILTRAVSMEDFTAIKRLFSKSSL